MSVRKCDDSPMPRQDAADQEAIDACALLCQRALQVIRASAYRREPIDAPTDFDGDFVEWIRVLADACDGLARPGAGSASAAGSLAYRRSAWSPVQESWAASVLHS